MNKRFLWCIAATFASGTVSEFIMVKAAHEPWYKNLIKPTFAPPQWSYGIVWPLLYTTMAVAAYLIWQKKNSVQKSPGLLLFFAHLLLNPLWIYLFFVAHNLQAAAALIVGITICAWTILYLFKKESEQAAYWFLPYCLWISYAAALSVSYYLNN
jgi:tryptophan-rich sensory protein